MRLSDWLFERLGRRHGIALSCLAELIFEYLVKGLGLPAERTAEALWLDYRSGGRNDKPRFLREYIGEADELHARGERPRGLKRQRRHLAHAGKEQARSPATELIRSG